jgi:competence protein ComEC
MSFLIQDSLRHPPASVQAGKKFETVQAELKVNEVSNRGYEVEVVAGELPSGSIGLLRSRLSLMRGDRFSSKLQLSPAASFSRYAFIASSNRFDSKVKHEPGWRLVNELRGWAAGQRGDAKCLVSGLSIGIDSCLSENFKVNMKKVGLTHLTAVSGANCVIVVGAIWLVLRRIKVGRGVRFITAIVVLCGYVALVGWQPSVLRAAFMTVVMMTALEFGARIRSMFALSFGASLLLIVDPWLLIDLGFWLSTLATAGLVLFGKPVYLQLCNWFPKPVAIGLSAAIVAQFLCLPILIYLQEGFPTYSVIANLVVEPVVAPITVLGLFAVLCGPWLPVIADSVLQVAEIFANWIVWVANALSQNTNGLFPMPPFYIVAVVIALVILYAIQRSQVSLIIASISSLLLLGFSVSMFVSSKTWHNDDWEIVSCDVGQGDATLIRSSGKVALIDTGKDEAVIDECLDEYGVSSIDLLVLTHFDIDHVGGTPGVLRGRAITQVLISDFPDSRPEAIYLRNTLGQVSNAVIEAPLGLSGQLGDVNWSVFSALGVFADSSNEGSLGIRFEAQGWVLWTMADLPASAQEQALGFCSSTTKLSIVKVSHHGSADQSAKFYDCIRADFALISVGAANSYGHPTKRLLMILEKNETEQLRTDQHGSIELSKLDGSYQFQWQRA